MVLKNKVALITGASSGIGRATALLFAREGAQVALLGRNQAALEQTAQIITQEGGKALVTPADVRDYEACKGAVDTVVTTSGQLDILVNAAGIIGMGSLDTTTREAWREMMAVNLDAVFQMMQLALPYLEKTRGNIVNVSSVTGVRAFPNILAYCVSKAGVDHLTRCAALELAPKGIRVNAVNPGVVVTQLHRRGGMDEAAYKAFLEHSKTTHPLGRVGEPEEIAEAILFLASDRSGWITGVTLSIDGGRHLTCAR
ncbi:MAG: SDR family oxidoreductase [Calditrichaeota bacterium]|nr:MAG: SDR family oxidoreductase [Calditrichota bacterium]